MPGDSFYKTKQWKALRAKVIRHARQRNLPCGYCGLPMNFHDRYSIIVDHKINRKQRPDLALLESNLHVVHHTCNTKKAKWDDNSDKPQIGADGFPLNSEWS